ncbi:MAG: hypothetical protein WDZ49_07330 [Litorilinea sp.]
MHRKRVTLWVTLLTVVVLTLAGCAPRATGGQTAALPGADQLAVDLPAIVIDFDSAGQPSVGNVPLAQLGSMVMPGVLDAVVLPADTVAFMTESNIQHIQIDNSPSGLLILVNGQPIPSLRWDGEILSATAETLSQLGMGVPALEKLLPLVNHLGLGVIARFPAAEGVAAIPTFIESPPSAAASKAAQEEFLASVGEAPRIILPVIYDTDGGWRVGDLTDAEWVSLTGMPWDALRLQSGVIQGLMAANISEIAINTDASGIHIGINGRQLPYIGWADGEINHVLDLAGQMGLWNTLADSGMNMGEIVTMVERLLPVVQTAETSINVYFPTEMAAVRPTSS